MAFLRRLRHHSVVEHDAWVEVRLVKAELVFADLGWPWDRQRAFSILKVTDHYRFSWAHLVGDEARIRWAGIVRVDDEPGHALEEAWAHLEANRLRAAGCIASVELERHLFNLGVRPTPTKGRDPNLQDYRQAAYPKVIDQETYSTIDLLAVTRKHCVHFIEPEPTRDAVAKLLEGVDHIMRKYPIAPSSSPTTSSKS